MEHRDFRIGIEFWCGEKRWRCTDVGSRVIIAMCLESHEVASHVPSDGCVSPRRLESHVTADASWLAGPPYAIVEHVFDEHDLPACSPMQDAVENGR